MAKERKTLPLDSIICGDALETLDALPASTVHLMITSPPYNLDKPYANHDDDLDYDEYLKWMGQVWKAAKRVLVRGGRLCINIGENKRQNITEPTYSAFIRQLADPDGPGMSYCTTLIWNKNSAAKHCAWGSWKSCSNPHIVPRHEYIIVFSKGEGGLEDLAVGLEESIDSGSSRAGPSQFDSAKDFRDATHSVWQFGTESRKRIGHPAPFPGRLPERLMKCYSRENDVVLDMFAGSGTVGVVAHRLNRRFVLIDNSRKYCELAQRRCAEEEQFTPSILAKRPRGSSFLPTNPGATVMSS